MVYNISMINFRERLGELGTMLILGRSEKDIGKMLFVEQMLYYAFGAVLGLLLIPPMEKLVQMLVETDDLHLNIHTDISHILMILAACFVLVCITNYRQYKAVSEIQLTDILKERC
jgi:putative ABC transport system permease protein